MMKSYYYPERGDWTAILVRPEVDSPVELTDICRHIFERVRADGDGAVAEYTLRFDGADLADLRVGDEEFARAEATVSGTLKEAIRTAAANIEAFHKAQIPDAVEWSDGLGVTCRQELRPIQRVGLYVPGGSAPLFSTVLMLAIPARLAGCGEVVLCTPPDRDGNVSAAILWTARLCGVRKVFKAGGAQAIAAMSVGTATIPRVDKIFGPGNRYVTAAKQYSMTCGTAIDMPAGPSEVMVVADATCVPRFAAADMLSQAEHGPDSQAILVTWEPSVAEAVTREVNLQLEALLRREMAVKSLESSRVIVVRDRDQALEIVNLYAPEHLILSVEDPSAFAARVVNAGSLFLGNYTPESAGDYASGTNHTLPTAGWARTFSGVNMDAFTKKITIQQITPAALAALAPTITTMARAEALDAHANAVTIRLSND